MYERFAALMNEKGLTAYRISKAINVSQSTLSDWKNGKSTPKTDKLQLIADYLEVSVDYLLGKTDIRQIPTESTWKAQLTSKDERDIKKELNSLLEDLESSEETLMYDGEPMDDLTKELFRNCLENALKVAKLAAKEKYTPKKYRK